MDTLPYGVLRTHYEQLVQYLGSQPNPLPEELVAQELINTAMVHLVEVIADVAEEVCRRKDPATPPLSPNRPEFSEERRQARRHLASISNGELCSVCHHLRQELQRRFPEFDNSGKLTYPSLFPEANGTLPPAYDEIYADVDVERRQYEILDRNVFSAPILAAARRRKLLILNKAQINELTVDVYDELLRRERTPGGPPLPAQETFHPKRNYARQKLATLPETRFRDLASDVHYELARRNPRLEVVFRLI